MVRVKNRYLLINILYPELEKTASNTKVPDIVAFHQPTTDALTPHALLKKIKEEVAELFGDYGSGAISESIVGKSHILACTYGRVLIDLQSNTCLPRLRL